ncbi:MAG: SOS response-associated peptidase family protein, partial [Alkalibacterium sp.]
MCGRYGLTASFMELKERYKLEDDDYSFKESEEIFPTTENIVLLPNQRLHPVKWGFEPSFAKRPLINARSESVLEKKTFKEPFGLLLARGGEVGVRCDPGPRLPDRPERHTAHHDRDRGRQPDRGSLLRLP